MLKYMLDTNICIFTIKERPAGVHEAFKQHHERMCISTVTLMELIDGAEKSNNSHHNLRDVEGFTARLEVFEHDADAAAHTGQIRADLAKAGQPVGPYDQMIAGHARSMGLVLVTNNVREFDRAPGLRIDDWTTTQPGR
ncbi:MAG: tRNA(fMet)-specific endonuclease VapC [Spiribacter salinus]|uniref:Ribonuclease VapC n=1 Tax=Spiribacter salinus TaxID=1335746 RepID=A0A540VQ94_9GAMM|nr:MAG: tRNA(fMet)-specific endonuclease VapC [Spiribacter salinus]